MPDAVDAVTVTAAPDPHLTRTREAVPVLTDAPADPDAELNRLIARRLRQQFAILAAIYAAFLCRQLLELAVNGRKDMADMAVQIVAFVVQSALAVTAALWRTAGPRWLAAGEWVSLATLWSTQGLNQLSGITSPQGMALIGDGPGGQVLIANAWFIPWYGVIAGYPVLIPHPVRRTAVIVGVTAALPILVTAVASAVSPDLTLARTWLMYAQFVLWGLVSGSIGVYGAAQAALLRKEAFEAKRYGQYRLVRKLGAGGMGEVHLAEHQLLRRPSVIKLVRPDRKTDANLIRRFEREVKRLATLTHWNTVQVFDYGHTADGTFYFVMEYLDGLNLDELVRRHGQLPPGRAVFLVRQVCAGLREAHAAGLIHRDVKPANVMACERGGLADVAKLLDFGLVRDASDVDSAEDDKLTREGAILGTPAFLSPEQAAGRPADARSDVYSVGCTLFYLLAARPVFDKKGVVETAAAHLHEPAKAPAECPADVAAVLLRCLAKDPAGRFQTVADLDAALAACVCAADWDHTQAAAWWKTRPG